MEPRDPARSESLVIWVSSVPAEAAGGRVKPGSSLTCVLQFVICQSVMESLSVMESVIESLPVIESVFCIKIGIS